MTHFFSVLYNARAFIVWFSLFILLVTGIVPFFVGFTYGAVLLPGYMNSCMLGPDADIKGLADTIKIFVKLEHSPIDLISYQFYVRNWRCAATECVSGTPDERIPACSEVIRSNPRAGWAYVNRAAAYLEQGYYSGAIADETNAIKIDPKSADAYYNRGVAYEKKGEHDNAITDFDRAIKIHPRNALVYVSRGIAYGRKGYYDKAIADSFDKAIEIEPENTDAYYNRGFAYYNRGFADLEKCDHDTGMADFDKAIADFDKAIADFDKVIPDSDKVIDPKSPDAYYLRGVAYGMKGDHDKAIADLDMAIELDPRNADAFNNRGIAYGMKGGDYDDQAIANFGKAIEIDVRNADVYSNRGGAYGRKGYYDKAIADYNKVIEIDPMSAAAYFNRGNAYENLGRKIEAIADYQSTLLFARGDKNARGALRRLGAAPDYPSANTQTMGERVMGTGRPLPDTHDLNQGAATYGPDDPQNVCTKKRERYAQLSMNTIMHNGLDELTDSYHGLHQTFNDDIVGALFSYYSKAVAWPFFQSGVRYGADGTIFFFNSYLIVRIVFVVAYFLVFFLMYELGKHIFSELFLKNFKRLKWWQ